MAEEPQKVLILHGEDEFAIQDQINTISADLGDPAMVDLNTTRLDGRTNSLDELLTAVSVLPFLTDYRLVIFFNPLNRLRTQPQQKSLLEILTKAAPTTRLVLVEYHLLTEERDRKRNRIHWLEKWALDNTSLAQVRACPVPVGVGLARWIQERAKAHQGIFTLQAANLLADQVGPEPTLLDHEIQKLLAYVNYNRAVEGDEVQHLTPKTAQVADFALVNALRDRDGRQALGILHRELEEVEPLFLFHRVVTQFRQLLQVREILENGGREDEMAKKLKIHPYAVRLAIQHARRFSLSDLDEIYKRLLQIDVAMKTGSMESELALDLLVTELTT